ncbi:tRNA (N(6)-L-threonylcarbamoyladenosine(37)-C(2))-methylthiotransferase MtaB [bacterium]|nr:tRNA (N(6)-L-threonylcarbamoyladenosine(37)-C(2))-methylthiotransferase MtaB [bacterium]
MPTFSILTLGCRANQSDSQRIAELLRQGGYEQVGQEEFADIGIMNSCTVTAEADRKGGQMLRRLQRKCSLVIATGCGTAKKGGLWDHIPEGVVIVPPSERENILRIIEKQQINITVGKRAANDANSDVCASKEDSGSEASADSFVRHRTRALLKVQEGCNHMCTFCIVPMVRGPLKSFEADELLPKIDGLIKEGFKEIVFTGTHLALWGRDPKSKILFRERGCEGRSFADLVEELILKTEGVRFRISSIEPMSFPKKLLDLMKAYPDRLCPHLHLVVQHASDRILKAMHRDYTLEEYEALAAEFLNSVPGACLTTDILLGFPGETEEDMEILEAFLRRVPFYHLHVFPYSRRQGTPAAEMADQVPEPIKKERVRRIIALGEESARQVYDSFRGTERAVLVERSAKRPGYVSGTADNFLSVEFEGDASLIGEIVKVKIP